MDDFVAIVTAVIGLFKTQFTLYGFTLSYWDVMIWTLVAGILIAFLKGVFFG